MISGIGIDIVELNRIETIMERQKRFADRILTEKEKEKFNTLKGKRKVEYLAGRFAAKEAFSKAYGTGIGKEISFLDIEITPDAKGKPYIVRPMQNRAHLSISHSTNYAVAQVIIEN